MFKDYKYKYTVLAAESQGSLEHSGSDYDCGADTVAEAKRMAKHVLTDEFSKSAEMSISFGYSQVTNQKGEVLHDFFRQFKFSVFAAESKGDINYERREYLHGADTLKEAMKMANYVVSDDACFSMRWLPKLGYAEVREDCKVVREFVRTENVEENVSVEPQEAEEEGMKI